MKQTLDYVKETCKRDEELIHRLKGSSLSSSTSSLASSSTHIRTPAAHEITLLTKHLAARKQLGKQIMKRLYSIFIVLLISTILIGVATVIAEFVLRNYMTSFYKIMMAFAVATMLVSIRLAHITYIGVLQYKKDAKLNKTLKLGSTFETTNAFQAHDDELDELDYGGLEIEEFLED